MVFVHRPISATVQRVGQCGVKLAKCLFSVLQLLHHAAIVKRQSDGHLTKSSERKVESLNKFVKPAHPCRRIADRKPESGVGAQCRDRSERSLHRRARLGSSLSSEC